jgi:hypothetical protein
MLCPGTARSPWYPYNRQHLHPCSASVVLAGYHHAAGVVVPTVDLTLSNPNASSDNAVELSVWRWYRLASFEFRPHKRYGRFSILMDL